MNAQKLIGILQQLSDPDLCEIEFYIQDKEGNESEQIYEVANVGQFGISTDATITLMPIDKPIMQPATFQRKHKDMIESTIKEIKEEK